MKELLAHGELDLSQLDAVTFPMLLTYARAVRDFISRTPKAPIN